MSVPVYWGKSIDPADDKPLAIDSQLVADWLVEFLRAEVRERRGFDSVVLGLSGGVDSAVVAYLCAAAFGPKSVLAVRMPYKSSSKESLEHARLVVDRLGLLERTIDITAMADGYAGTDATMTPLRLGNVCARSRMIVLFDLSAADQALPIGTGNKTERLFGYYTWHGDDAPPVNPLGDLFKTQVWALARHLGVPDEIVNKRPTADLVQDQTDEGDLGVDYLTADRILCRLVRGVTGEQLVRAGFKAETVALVERKVASTHWKRNLPSVAMISDSAIRESYLRPVDY